jgi:signal transduction histidine kinase
MSFPQSRRFLDRVFLDRVSTSGLARRLSRARRLSCERVLAWAALALAIVSAFALDVLTPAGTADGFGYPVALVLCLWVRRPAALYASAVLCTLLTIVTSLWFLQSGNLQASLVNRALALASIWAMTELLAEILGLEAGLRKSERALDAAREAHASFLAAMRHELRSRLGAILGFSDAMLRERFGPIGSPAYRRYLAEINASADHLLQLADEAHEIAEPGGKDGAPGLASGVRRPMAPAVASPEAAGIAKDAPPAAP